MSKSNIRITKKGVYVLVFVLLLGAYMFAIVRPNYEQRLDFKVCKEHANNIYVYDENLGCMTVPCTPLTNDNNSVKKVECPVYIKDKTNIWLP